MAEKNEVRELPPVYCTADDVERPPKPDTTLIKEAVRRTIEQYGEVLRRLADE